MAELSDTIKQQISHQDVLALAGLVNSGYEIKNQTLITKSGISIRYWYNNMWQCFIRNKNGGYVLHKHGTLDDIASYVHGITIPQIQKRNKILLDPQEFKDITEQYSYSCNNVKINNNTWKAIKIVIRESVIKTAGVVGIVSINDDLSLNDEVSTPEDKEVWFHIDCTNDLGATFDIISNGDVWYPIKRYGCKRITNNMNPKSSVHLDKLSVADQNLINEAIRQFLV